MSNPNFRGLLLPPLPLALVTALGLGAGCSSTPAPDSGPQRVDTFVGWVERVHVETEVAQERAAIALDALGMLVAPESVADPVIAFSAFVAAVEESETQATALKQAFQEMKKSAGPVFERWEVDAEGIASGSLRERSRARMVTAREQYAGLVSSLEPALGALQQLNRTLRDHALFLSHDLNEGALAVLAEEVETLEATARALDERLGVGREAARDYALANALPVRGPQTEGGSPAAAPQD